MPLLYTLAVSMITILGGLMAAVLLASLAWWLASRLHHRRWGWALLLGMVGGAWLAALGHSEFFKMAFIFTVVAAGGLYFAAQAAPGKRS